MARQSMALIRAGGLAAVAAVCVLAQVVAAAAQTLARDPDIEYALRQLAQPLVTAAGLSAGRIDVLVVQDDRMNAFVINDRAVYMHSGLILMVDSAAELQAVIAHELAHIANGHISRRMVNRRVAQRNARQEGDWRIQPQGFPEYCPHQRQAFGMFERQRAVADNLVDLRPQAGHQFRLVGQDVEHPGQRAGRGFVTGEKEYAELVDQFVAGKGLTAVGIAGSDHGAGDIVIVRIGGQVWINQATQVGTDTLTGGQHYAAGDPR